jgi:hypothetical protein
VESLVKDDELEIGDYLVCDSCDHPILKCKKIPETNQINYEDHFQGLEENNFSDFSGSKGECPKCVGGRWFAIEPFFSVSVRGKGWLFIRD